MNLYKIYTIKSYNFFVIDATLASDNPLRFKKNLSERIQKLIRTTNDKFRDEELKCDINKEAAKNSAQSSVNQLKSV